LKVEHNEAPLYGTNVYKLLRANLSDPTYSLQIACRL